MNGFPKIGEKAVTTTAMAEREAAGERSERGTLHAEDWKVCALGAMSWGYLLGYVLTQLPFVPVRIQKSHPSTPQHHSSPHPFA